jgi:short-subunit dehydrogenase
MKPYFDYRGKIIAVTGASGGLGLALVEQLGEQGARVERIARDAQWEPAGFDIVFLNAAIGYVQASDRQVLDDAQQMFQINFLQTVNDAQRALSGKCNHVHVVGSVVSHISAPHLALYAASKHALRGWAYGAARELPGRISISYPNGMRSKFFNNLKGDPALIELYSSQVEKAQEDYDHPELVAQGILAGIQMGAREIIPTPYALDWFVKNEVDIRRMWHPRLAQPSVEKWDWWDAVLRHLDTLK